MLLAELEIFHSRPIAPTRRISIGRAWLPGPQDGTGPGFGSLLLGGVCARFGPGLSHDLLGEVVELVHQLEEGQSVAQPRLRNRLQRDRVGLARSRQRLYGGDRSGPEDELVCEFDGSRATPGQLVLGAAYAAGLAAPLVRGEALRAVRRGLAGGARWGRHCSPTWHRASSRRGLLGPLPIPSAGPSYLASGQQSPRPARAIADPVGWALEMLGFDREVELPAQAAVRQGFREALRAAHPDLGAAETEAADRIAELSEARRILLTL